MFYDRGNHYEFLSLGQELAAPGELQHPQTFPFNFKNVEKQYESYNGINVKLRYFTRVTVSRRMADVIREKDIWVYSYRIPPEINSSIKMDVGIEDCLHIEFEYSKSKYHLKDVIVGRIYFLLVRLKIKHMELSIIRRETTGVAPNQYNESETLVRFEIMDGSPSRGETIPIRLFLGGFDLTPTFREVNKKYSVRYYLSLVLIDEGKQVLSFPYYPKSRTHKRDLSMYLEAVLPLSAEMNFHHAFCGIANSGICGWPQTRRRKNPCPSGASHEADIHDLIDARRYFKQSEIVLFRQAPENQPHLALDKPSIGGKEPERSPLIPA